MTIYLFVYYLFIVLFAIIRDELRWLMHDANSRPLPRTYDNTGSTSSKEDKPVGDVARDAASFAA